MRSQLTAVLSELQSDNAGFGDALLVSIDTLSEMVMIADAATLHAGETALTRVRTLAMPSWLNQVLKMHGRHPKTCNILWAYSHVKAMYLTPQSKMTMAG